MNTPYHTCEICNKIYSSKSSLCNHNKKFHSKLKVQEESQKGSILGLKGSNGSIKGSNILQENPIKINKSLTCENCNKVFNYKSSKSMHKKKCITQEKESPKIINNNTTNNNTTNNITNNNNTYNITYNFNSEENKDEFLKMKMMTDKKKIELLLYTDPINYILRIVEMFNCGDNKNFANVLINNLKSKYIGISQDGEFISEYKDTVLNKVIDNSYWALSAIRDNITYRFNNNGTGECDEINLTKTAFEKLTDKYIDFSDNYYDTRNEKNEYVVKENPTVKYKNFDALNKERISMLLYNNRMKIKNKHDEKEEN